MNKEQFDIFYQNLADKEEIVLHLMSPHVSYITVKIIEFGDNGLIIRRQLGSGYVKEFIFYHAIARVSLNIIEAP